MPYNILVATSTQESGGAESFLMNYFRHIRLPGIHFLFMGNSAEFAYSDEICNLGGEVVLLTASRGKNYLEYQNYLRELFVRYAFTAVWLNDCSAASASILKIAAKYGVITRIAYAHASFFMKHGIGGLFHRVSHYYGINIIKKYATHRFACSDNAARFFCGSDSQESKSIQIIPGAIDTYKFFYSEKKCMECRGSLGLQDRFVIGYIGGSHFQNNHTYLINIFAKVLEQKKDAVLLVIGSSDNEKFIREKIKHHQFIDSIKFLGMRDDISDLLCAMDAFILPSPFESLPIVAVEAQCAGLPTFLSDTVTDEVVITDLVQRLPINAPPDVWAKQIVKSKPVDDRSIYRQIVCDKGFDITEAAHKMAMVLTGMSAYY